MIGFALIFQMHLVKYLEAVLHQEVQVAGKGRVSQRNTLSFCVPHLRQILTRESASEKVSLCLIWSCLSSDPLAEPWFYSFCRVCPVEVWSVL